MDTLEKIEKIKLAIEKAEAFQSQLSEDAIRIPMLGSLKIRALLNNLGGLGTHYLSIGVHKGGSTCSAVFGNPLLTVHAVDSFESDKDNQADAAEPQFIDNMNKVLSPSTQLTIIKSDSFAVDLAQIPFPIDFYDYDADHSEESQKKALTYYLPVLADEFILCVDDYGWKDVKEGTQKGIAEGGLEILFEKELVTDKEYSNESWWTGYYIALLRKKVGGQATTSEANGEIENNKSTEAKSKKKK